MSQPTLLLRHMGGQTATPNKRKRHLRSIYILVVGLALTVPGIMLIARLAKFMVAFAFVRGGTRGKLAAWDERQEELMTWFKVRQWSWRSLSDLPGAACTSVDLRYCDCFNAGILGALARKLSQGRAGSRCDDTCLIVSLVTGAAVADDCGGGGRGGDDGEMKLNATFRKLQVTAPPPRNITSQVFPLHLLLQQLQPPLLVKKIREKHGSKR